MIRQKILVVDDDKLIRWSLHQKLSSWNLKSFEAEDGKSALQMIESDDPDLILLDVNLPDIKGLDVLRKVKKKWPEIPVIMITAFGEVDDAVSAIKHGAYEFLIKPINESKLQQTIKNALEAVWLREEVAYYKEKEKKGFELSRIVAESPQMKSILDMTVTVAQSEAFIVLLQGESGTGKDLLAQALHYLSRRKSAPFLAINCSAIPDNLLESELFGYEKGAFTDAKQRKRGLIEIAHKGTLFLDEISTLNLHLQAKLLRFLETQTFMRIGGLKDIEVDIRVITATNQNLETAVKNETFRKDLYFRLNVFPILIPPLREREKDILPLAEHFIHEYNLKFRKKIKGLGEESKKLFLKYQWPGNIRELKNAIERAMIFESGSLITKKNLPINLNGKSISFDNISNGKTKHQDLTLSQIERTFLVDALKRKNGNKSQAAKLLGITRDTLRYKVKKHHIKLKDYIS